MIKVTNIIWATDGEECLELPSTVTINSEISEEDTIRGRFVGLFFLYANF